MYAKTPKIPLPRLFLFALIFSIFTFTSCGSEETQENQEPDKTEVSNAATSETSTESGTESDAISTTEITSEETESTQPESVEEGTGETETVAEIESVKTEPQPTEEEITKTTSSNGQLKGATETSESGGLKNNTTNTTSETPPKQFDIHQHLTWNSLVKKNVSSSGKVNYRGFKSSQAELNQYLDELRAHPPQSSWSRNQKLAYWINVYNAFTVDLVVRHYPVKSITDIGKPWDIKFVDIGGKTYTLSEVENSVIRPTFKEPRVHFALNCASKSCPKLINKAYTASNLNGLLSSQTRKYLADSRENILDAKKSEISQIFEWYAEDFLQKGTLVEFLNKYSDAGLTEKTKITYKQYDWSLNE